MSVYRGAFKRVKRMSQDTHVSSSVCSGAGQGADGAGADGAGADGADKERGVAEYVVRALFAEKKKKLALAVNTEIEGLCAAGAVSAGDQSVECYRVLARRGWPALERELVSDLAGCICEARRAQCRAEQALALFKVDAHEVHRDQARSLFAMNDEQARLRAQVAEVREELALKARENAEVSEELAAAKQKLRKARKTCGAMHEVLAAAKKEHAALKADV